MQLANSIFATLFLVIASLSSGAQSMDFLDFTKPLPNYRQCAAIFFEGEMLVDDYSPKGKCKIDKVVQGLITVSTVDLSDANHTAIKNISFQVAIKNRRTKTIRMFSTEAITEVYLEDILKSCEGGDTVIIMTIDPQYSLTHHEIEVMAGC
jgi:hypothetical protein